MSLIETPKRVRYAVVGAGNIAQVAVLPAFEHARENSELGAIVSGDATKLAELGHRYDVPTAGYDDFERLLERERIDAVYLALPNTHHRPFTERAASTGVHVLCEKPMAATEADARAMAMACRAARVRLMVAYRLHFEEANLRAIELVRSGVIGDPRYVTATFSQVVRPGDIRTRQDVGGGALLDLGVYPINAVRNLFRDEPQEVFAYSVGGAVDTAVFATLRFGGDRYAQFTVHQGAAGTSSYRVVGTEGDLRVEPAFEYDVGLVHHVTRNGKTSTTEFGRRDQFAPELVYFSRCIAEGKEPEPSAEEGIADVRVADALRTSARTGRPVVLPAFKRSARPDLSLEMHMPPVRRVKPVHAPSPSLK